GPSSFSASRDGGMPLRWDARRGESPATGLPAAAGVALDGLGAADRELFLLRLARSREDLFGPLARLYGDHPSYPAFVEDLLQVLAEGWAARPADLRQLDLRRDLEPDWFLRERNVGYVFYVDRFAGSIAGVAE